MTKLNQPHTLQLHTASFPKAAYGSFAPHTNIWNSRYLSNLTENSVVTTLTNSEFVSEHAVAVAH